MDSEGARLLTVLIAYDKPRLCMNIDYYVLRLSLTGRLQCTLHCAGTGSIVVKVQCQVLNQQHEMNFDNYSLIRK